MKQVKTSEEALKVFDLLGIKEVTKKWQKKKGTQVFELPFKTMYANGCKEINRFSVYRSGYIRKMVVNSNGASYSCYQLNKKYKSKRKYFNSYYKEYRTFDTYKRIMIYNEDDRLVYLCNYILKNYYRNQTGASFYRISDYQVKLMERYSDNYWKDEESDQQLPFVDNAVNKILKDNIDNNVPFGDMVHPDSTPQDDIQVIINGHRYKLS
jgi:hypothetical protein